MTNLTLSLVFGRIYLAGEGLNHTIEVGYEPNLPDGRGVGWRALFPFTRRPERFHPRQFQSGSILRRRLMPSSSPAWSSVTMKCRVRETCSIIVRKFLRCPLSVSLVRIPCHLGATWPATELRKGRAQGSAAASAWIDPNKN